MGTKLFLNNADADLMCVKQETVHWWSARYTLLDIVN